MSASGAATPWSTIRDAVAVLVPHAGVHRRAVRGAPWATLHNALNGEQVRVNGAALAVVLALDGERDVETVLEEVVPAADEEVRDALARALLTLESSGLLRFGRPADTERLLARRHAAARRRFDPLALRLPLHDPDAWLARLVPYVTRLDGRLVLAACAVIVAWALGVALTHTEAIAGELARLGTTPSRWWLYAALYPALKFVHELAHALVVKRFGGAVHEAGLTVLVLMPIPYVDASDSNRFERRGQRLAVGAAGLVAEAVAAAAGLLLWSATEAGALHDAAFAVAVLGSVATLLFNANPLLRFDGYHLLQDLLDMPNLGTRASAYLGWLVRRHVLRARAGRAPVTGPRERRWLLSYGLASLVYRWWLTFAIALYLVATIPVAGVALASFAVYRLAVRPLLRALRYLRESEEIGEHRVRAGATVVAIAFALVACVSLVPMPASTRIEGVVRPAAQTALHAGVGGALAEVLVPPGAVVHAGQPVLRLAAPELKAARAILATRIDVLVTRRRALMDSDPVEAARLASDIAVARREDAERARELDALEIRAPGAGRFAPGEGGIARGRAVRRGEVLGHVVGDGALSVDAVIGQRRIGRVRDGVRSVRVRLAERLHESVPGRLLAATPAADRRLPSASLAFDGTRGIAVASGEEELRTLEPVFHLELGLPEDARVAGIGGRAYVTLVHDPESLGRRWWRAARQLFLEKLSV